MIPLRDDVQTRTVPFVNYALIGANVLAFLLELSLGDQLPSSWPSFGRAHPLHGRDHCVGIVEALLDTLNPDLGFRLLFSMFLHGGFAHILGNMLYSGSSRQRRRPLGHFRYVLSTCLRLVASYAQSGPAPPRGSLRSAPRERSRRPRRVHHTPPHAHVVTLLPLGFSPDREDSRGLLPGFWFLQQFLMGAMSLGVRTARRVVSLVGAHRRIRGGRGAGPPARGRAPAAARGA